MFRRVSMQEPAPASATRIWPRWIWFVAAIVIITTMARTRRELSSLLLMTQSHHSITNTVDDGIAARHVDMEDSSNVASLPFMSMEERVRVLELKLNSYLNWARYPSFGTRTTSECKNSSELVEYGCERDDRCPGLFDHRVCLDALTANDCLVYDFGVRAQPEFGLVMAKTFGCEVHAFDPSPVSTEWFQKLPDSHDLKRMPNYHFHAFGAGGIDGDIQLQEYNWEQVSIMKYPQWLRNCGEPGIGVECNKTWVKQRSFKLPVKTLAGTLKLLGHEQRTIDILKIDVEGSEYQFLYSMFDAFGCPHFVNQITLEWHHYPVDVRYGEGSNPDLNVISTMLHACGLKSFWIHSEAGWDSDAKMYHDLGMKDVRYNLQSFHRPS